MLRKLVIVAMNFCFVLACAQSPSTAKSTLTPKPGPAPAQPSGAAPDQVSPDDVVIVIPGYCPGETKNAAQDCTRTITKAEFGRMLSAMSFNSQFASNPVAVRSFAESYVQSLALAEAAEKSGLDKDPQFQELMRIVRVRALADAYRRAAQLKITVLKDEDLGSYYKHNIARFEQVELDRITVPRVNAKLAKEAQADFQKKADKLAADVRARIAAGEEPGTVQAEAYKALGLTPPLTTDLGLRRRGNLPPAIEDEIFSLKAGEVTKLQTDPVNVSMYKVRSRSIIPLAQAKAEIEQQMRQKRLQAELEEATGKREPQFNEKYFGTRTVSRTPAGGRNAAAQR